jgi:hypothetical protein
LDGAGGAVVLAGLPDDRVRVVLAAVVDGHPHPEGESGLAVLHGRPSVVAALVGGHAELGVEPVEGLLSSAGGVPLDPRVDVVELVGEAGVVVAVAGVKVAAEAVGDLVGWTVAELVAAPGGRGLKVLQQLAVILAGVVVLLLARVWRPGWGGV